MVKLCKKNIMNFNGSKYFLMPKKSDDRLL